MRGSAGLTGATRGRSCPGAAEGVGTLTPVSASQHVHALPDDAEVARLVGAATPHFALQIRDRLGALIASLPEGHERRPFLVEQIARLDALAVDGEAGGDPMPDLPGRASLTVTGA